ncbi:MAG: sigma-70 family RNA polymerase sigma factor [Verrucomicrobiae bacterium]|nr:sigma-70 family RNA polymerase sigma factor [Verrucomicrobiae bacterium]NNJ43870.1 sigma-70 family RNA polymerase sigma factor [Akkermansiaceae bacterium]
MSSSDQQNDLAFVGLLTKHQADLWAYVITLMPGDSEAADVLQKVNMVLWKKQGDFEIGTNFRAWSFSIARFEVLAHLKKRKREGIVLMDEELLETVTEEIPDSLLSSDLRLDALEHCLKKLRPQDRKLLDHRYKSGLSLARFASEAGRSVSSLSVTLHRLRAALRECVNRRLSEKGAEL